LPGREAFREAAVDVIALDMALDHLLLSMQAKSGSLSYGFFVGLSVEGNGRPCWTFLSKPSCAIGVSRGLGLSGNWSGNSNGT
jgi:hypothetical protein